MKTSIPLFAFLTLSSAVWAETPITASTAPVVPPVVISTPTASPVAPVAPPTAPEVHASTTPLSAAITGETIGAPAPHALTDRPGAGVFVTLTRNAVSNKDLPSNTQIITQDDIRITNAQTAGDALRFATSVQIPTQGTTGATQLAGIRGATSNETLVLIDGRPVGGSSLSGSQDLSEIPAEQIDHIEIVRGGVSALYGPNAMGGVINIITKRATYSGVPLSHVGFETGRFDRQALRLDFGSRFKRFDYFFFGDEQRESGFRNNSDDRSHNIGGNAGLSMGAGGKLLFDASSYHSEAGVPGQFYPDLNPSAFNNETEKQSTSPLARQDTTTNYLRTSYLLPLPMNSLMTLRAFGSQREVVFKNPDPFFPSNDDRHEQSKGVDGQLSLPLGFLVGGNFLHDRLDSSDVVTPTNNYIASVDNWGIFAQDTMKWKMVRLTPSGRFDHNGDFGQTSNPRVLLEDDATDWLRFSGDASRSFRAPTLDDLFTPLETFGPFGSYQGNPNLKPETAWTYDAGFDIHIASYSFKLTYFRSNIKNLIQTTADFNATTVNVGEARRQGGELEISHTVNEYFRDSWNYTYLRNQGMPLGYDHLVTLRLSPKNTLNYNATITPIKSVTFDNTVKYESNQFEANDEGNDPFANQTKIGSHIIWDMKLTYAWRQLDIYAGMDDVTGKRYEERAGYPLPGRTIYAGVRLRLWG